MLPPLSPLASPFRLASTTGPASAPLDAGVDVTMAPLAALKPPPGSVTPRTAPPLLPPLPLVGVELWLIWARGPLAGLVPFAAS